MFFFADEPGDRTSGTGILSPSARTCSITVRTPFFVIEEELEQSDQWDSYICAVEQKTPTAWAAWRTGASTAWRTAACSWSAAPSRSERSSTGSCRNLTTIAGWRWVWWVRGFTGRCLLFNPEGFVLQIKFDDRVLRTEQGLLIRSLAQSDTGVYHCQAVEHGFIQPLLRLNLQVIPAQKLGEILPGLPAADGGVDPSAKHRLWYRDFLSLLDHPDLSSVEEFCDRVWKKERKQKRVKTPNVNGQGRTDGGSNSALQPKAPNPQRQQAGVPQSRPWLQPGGPAAEKSEKGTQTVAGQEPKNNQKTPKGNAAASSAVGGSRANSQHAAKWRRMQENKKGRNRRTHELQRPPRSV